MSFFQITSPTSRTSKEASSSSSSSSSIAAFNAKSTAYECRVVLSGLPLVIESLCGYDDNLLVGTKEGHLLIYKVKIEPCMSPPIPVDVHITHSNKHFSKKPIIQLDVIPEHKVLISLTSESGISVHDMELYTCPTIATIERTKGATLFSLDIQRQKSLTGNPTVTVRMCVAVGKRLQLFYWKNRSFNELREDFYVPDTPRAITWCKETLCIGFRNEYVTLSLMTGEQKELCSTGKQGEAIIAKVSSDTFALVQEKKAVLKKIDDAGIAPYVKWTEVPTAIVYDEPYILAIHSGKWVEILTIKPKLNIDSFQLPTTSAKFISCSNRGTVYIASNDNVWCLKSTPVDAQIDAFLKQRQFELALSLANIYDVSEKDRAAMTNKIQMQYAFHLFCRKQFEESMTIFHNLGTDVPQVIGLFPNLLPPDYQQKMVYSGKLPELEGNDLEKGLNALQGFLTCMRVNFVRNLNQSVMNPASIVEGAQPMVNKRKVLQIIDTTLLKCYLKTNESLVSSLLRLNENYCHYEETERILKQHNKVSELIILYCSKKEHRKALELLQRHSDIPAIIDYLQNLSSEHIEIILEFAKYVLERNQEDGIKIFTEEFPEVESLPRPRIYDFLDRNFKNLAIPYLQHVINVWDEKNPLFHNALIHHLREKILNYDDPDASLEAKRVLLEFLKTSKFYTPENVLALFPYNDMYEERALILERLGRHEQALSIYVVVMKDKEKAKEYCNRVYSKNDRNKKEVYTIFMRMLLNPPTSIMPGIALDADKQDAEPDLVEAISLLHDYAPNIEPSRALGCLPDDVEMKEIQNFLKTSIQNHSAEKRKLLLTKGLAESEYRKANIEKATVESERFCVPESSICAVCGKRIANQRILSAFCRFPDGSIVHYMCQQQLHSEDLDRAMKHF